MNHFIYAMQGEAPAPASGGTTRGWFEYYKWDIDDIAFLPFPEDTLIGSEPKAGDVLWFVMDKNVLGCVPLHDVRPDPLNNCIEFHYDTRFIQPTGGVRVESIDSTGQASDTAWFDGLKRKYDAQYPPRNHSQPCPDPADEASK